MHSVQVFKRPNVYERDIDALLERRLNLDQKFLSWFAANIAAQSSEEMSFSTANVRRQVPHEGAAGTIDLLVCLSDVARETGRILIENKLDSSFTPTQPQRYGSSALAMSRSGRPALATICAPRDYLTTSKYLSPFKARISYEDIAEQLSGDDRKLVEDAILRFALPYEPDPVPEVAGFHEGYVALAAELAPELVVKKNPNPNGERPEASRTIYFLAKACLPTYAFLPTLRFSHQCWDSSAPSPSVKVMFDGWAVYEPILRDAAKEALGNTGFYLRKAGRSLGLVAETPRMDNKKSVSSQIGNVSRGIQAAAALRAWMFGNEEVLRDWVDAANK